MMSVIKHIQIKRFVMYDFFKLKRFISTRWDDIKMLEGNKYSNNLYPITEFRKIIGNNKNSILEKVNRISFKFLLNLNLFLFLIKINEGKKWISQIKIALLAGAIIMSPAGEIFLYKIK